MAILDRLRTASFRGIEFFIESSTVEGGRKQSTFEFINTGRRSNQDLGKYERKYDILAYIMGTDSQYFERRNSLLDALETEGAGELIHPFYGNLNVTTGIYKLDESTKSLGYSTIRFVAEVVGNEILSEQGNPFVRPQDDVTVSQISNTSDIAKDDLAADLADESVLIPEFPSNLSSMESILKDGLSVFNDTLGPLAENAQNAISWANGIAKLVEDTNRLINNPTVLFSNIVDGITGVDGLTSSAIAATARLQNLFNYGQTDETNPVFTSSETIIGELTSLETTPPTSNNPEYVDGVIVPKSQEQINRLRNAEIAVVLFQGSAFIEYLNQSARINFNNTDEIDSTIDAIETQYDKLSPQLGENSLETVAKLRDEVRILLNNKRLNTNNISEIDVYKEPLSILTYNLYASTEQAENIVSLNGISDTMEITGTIRVENNDSVTSQQ